MVIGLYEMNSAKNKIPRGAYPVALNTLLPVLLQLNIKSCADEIANVIALDLNIPITGEVLLSVPFIDEWDGNRFVKTYTVMEYPYHVEFLLDEQELERYWHEVVGNGVFSGSVVRCNRPYDKAPSKTEKKFGLLWVAFAADENKKQYAIVINPNFLQEDIQICGSGKLRLFQKSMVAILRVLRSMSYVTIKHITLV
jgi:hypothetical protein